MKRLRIAFWERVFQASVKFTNWALVKRSRACGCDACKHVAYLTLTMAKFGKLRPVGTSAHAPGLN